MRDLLQVPSTVDPNVLGPFEGVEPIVIDNVGQKLYRYMVKDPVQFSERMQRQLGNNGYRSVILTAGEKSIPELGPNNRCKVVIIVPHEKTPTSVIVEALDAAARCVSEYSGCVAVIRKGEPSGY